MIQSKSSFLSASVDTADRLLKLVKALRRTLKRKGNLVTNQDALSMLDPLRYAFEHADEMEVFASQEADSLNHFLRWTNQTAARSMEEVILREELEDAFRQFAQGDANSPVRPTMLHWLKVWTRCLFIHLLEQRRLYSATRNATAEVL